MSTPPDPALRPPDTRPRWWLTLLAPVAAGVAMAHLLPSAHPTLLQRAAGFGGLKLGADVLRGRAWPHAHRFLDEIAHEWLLWLIVCAAYLLFVVLAQRDARTVPLPTWPALLAYWILWFP